MLRSGSGRARLLGAALVFLTCAICVCAFAADKTSPQPSASPSAKRTLDLTNLPLPIGQEAKGLVLPEFNIAGHMVGRVEAATAKRTDEAHILFTGIKLLTYTEANQPDLQIDMSDSILDLKTRVVSSPHRTTVQRADFNIAGDRFEFDTTTRIGALHGNVKMVLVGKEHLQPAQEEKESASE